MALTNNLKTQVDLPVWEWTRFAPATTSATSCLTTTADGSSKYLYYLNGTTLYRYDTRADAWQVLSNAPVTPATTLAMQYIKNKGWRGQVLSATSSSLQLPSINQNLNGYQIKIISGTGAGQTRTITATGNEVIHDTAVTTAITTNIYTDTKKRWKHNQWEGYGVCIKFNATAAGSPSYRDIVYNDPTSLTVFDANYEGRNFLASSAPSNALPYATLTAGAVCTIVSQTVTVDTPWEVIPDSSSKFMVISGQIAILTVTSLYLYDILSDRWVPKLTPTGLINQTNPFVTDLIMTRTSDVVGYYFTGSITEFTSQSITDSTLSLTKGDWRHSVVQIISGSGAGQEVRIANNTDNKLLLSSKFEIMPNTSSIYGVTSEDALWIQGNGRAQMFKYYTEPSLWSTGNITEYGVPLQMALIKDRNLFQSHGVTTATRVTTGITAVNPIPTAAGANYSVGDLLTVSTGGTLGRVYVERVSDVGAVLQVSLYTCGGGYSVGTGRATTGGTGTGCTIEITSVGTIGVITTPINHDFQLGETVRYAGATEDAWNTTYTILGIQSATIVEFIITATANAVARYSNATTLLVDVTKKWDTNEHVGKVIGLQAGGLTGALVWRRIVGNSENTISFIATGTAPANGSSRYFIQDIDAFGEDETYLDQPGFGYPTSTTTSSITDTTKNWFPAAWDNHRIFLTHDNGLTTEDIIVTNTSSSLNIGRTVAVGTGTNTIAYNNRLGSGSYTGSGASIFTTQGNGICWSGTRFVAAGSGTNTLAWSNDGITWNALGATIFSTSGNGVAFNGYRFVGAGSGTNTIAWSHEGATWTGLGTSIFSTQGNAIAWNGSRWVAMGQGTNTIAYSNDTGSIAFIGAGTSTFSVAGLGVCWAGSQWVGMGSGSNTYATSSDGITWSGGGTSIFTGRGNAVAWNGQITVAVGSGSNTIAYSTDSGSTWTGLGTSIFTTAGLSIAWNGTHWIAGGQGTNTTAYSADGINWTGNGSIIITSLVNGICSTSPYGSMTPNIGIAPTTNTRYKILNATGNATAGSGTTLTDTTKKWIPGQWVGKRVLLTSGTGQTFEHAITANTATSLTFASSTGPDATSTYTIIGRLPTGVASSLDWNFSSSLAESKGKRLISSRGAGTYFFDVYNISTNKWDYNLFSNGVGESMTTGTMYWYDGDRIYYTITTSGRVFYYDFVKNKIEAFGQIPYGMSTAILSSRMAIIKTDDGLKYLYIMRHTGTEMWRTLIYY